MARRSMLLAMMLASALTQPACSDGNGKGDADGDVS